MRNRVMRDEHGGVHDYVLDVFMSVLDCDEMDVIDDDSLSGRDKRGKKGENCAYVLLGSFLWLSNGGRVWEMHVRL